MGPIAERSNLSCELGCGRGDLSLNPGKGWRTKYTPYYLRTYSRYPIMMNYAKGDQILGPATYQSPPKSYIAGPPQVSEATPPLSWSNHIEKSRRKAGKKQ